MYSEKTLRKKAADAGYSIHKRFAHFHDGSIVSYYGERESGYNVVDETTGFCVWGCYDMNRDCLWQLEDVEKFLKKVYEDAGLKF